MTSASEDPVIPPVRRAFRALAGTIVPAAAELDRDGWTEVEACIEAALQNRPPRLRRQLRLLVLALEWMPLLRHGRRFSSLGAACRTEMLERVQASSGLLLRRGFWGLRTLVLLGYYGRPDVRSAIGYRAHPHGWEARGAGPRGAPGEGAEALGEGLEAEPAAGGEATPGDGGTP